MSFEEKTFSSADPYAITSTPSTTIFQPTEFIVRRVEQSLFLCYIIILTSFVIIQQPSIDDSSAMKCRQLEERIRALENLVHEKDSIIHDLQRKLDNTTRVNILFSTVIFDFCRFIQDLNDAEQQIYILQRDKLTLIKALTNLETNSSGGTDHPASTVRTGFITRN